MGEIIGKFMNQLELRRDLKEARKFGYNSDIRELPDKTKKIDKLLDHSKQKLSSQQMLLENKEKKQEKIKNNSLIIRQNNSIVKHNEKNNEIMESSNLIWPTIFVYLVKDRASISVVLNKISLHKHGFRKFISWGPIKETLIAGCLSQLNFIEDSRKYIFFLILYNFLNFHI